MTTADDIILSGSLVLVILTVIEILALARLYRNITRFQHYWQRIAKQNGQFIYIALGDSAAQGLGASLPQNGYVGLLASDIATQTRQSVQIINVSKSGAKVADVLSEQLPKIQGLHAHLVTIEIGANDVSSFDEADFRRDFLKLAELLPSKSYVANMPYFGSRPAKRASAQRISAIIKEILQNQPQLIAVDLQSITRQKSSILGYAADFFHPNDLAYRNWAEAFWLQIKHHL